MSESFDSVSGTGGSNVDFWRNMLSENSQEGWCSRLDDDWGHVLKNNKKVTRKMRGSRSNTMNSGSDISEALSFISTELSLSSSSTSRSYGETDEAAHKDQDAHNLQEKMDVSIEQLSGTKHLEYLSVCVGGAIPSSESIEGDTFDASGEVNKDNFQVPKLGMTFSTEKEVYEFYKGYAMEIGFKVRKAKVQRLLDGSISKRYLFCSKQGLKQPSKKLRKYRRKVTRTGCQAKIQCAVKNGKWVISQVCVQHNHHLECPKQVKRPYAKTSEAQLTIHPENETKIISKEGGVLLKDRFEGGATWAFEVGSQSMVCPILVEDLNLPRQMLVEMLCDSGFFLEIADLIRGLGLTILRGVMEAQNDKIWAGFAVEANRDITRMEIFMSLHDFWSKL